MLTNVSDPDRAVIDSFQPYHRVNPDRDPLAILRALRDAYEHREIATVQSPSSERRPTSSELVPRTTPSADAQFRGVPSGPHSKTTQRSRGQSPPTRTRR